MHFRRSQCSSSSDPEHLGRKPQTGRFKLRFDKHSSSNGLGGKVNQQDTIYLIRISDRVLWQTCDNQVFCCVPSPPRSPLVLSAPVGDALSFLWACPQLCSSVLCQVSAAQISSGFEPTLGFCFPSSSRVCSCRLFLGRPRSLHYSLGGVLVLLMNVLSFCPATCICPSVLGLLRPLGLEQYFPSTFCQNFYPPAFFFLSELHIKVCCPSRCNLSSTAVLRKIKCARQSQGDVGDKQLLSQEDWPGPHAVSWWSQDHTVSDKAFLWRLCQAAVTEPQPRWHRTTEICCPWIWLEVQNQDICKGVLPLNTVGESSSWLPSFWWFAGNFGQSLTWRCVTPFTWLSSPHVPSHCLLSLCASISASKLLLSIRIPVTLDSNPTYKPHLTFIISKDTLQTGSHSEVLEVKDINVSFFWEPPFNP